MFHESGEYRASVRKCKNGQYTVKLFGVSVDPHYDDLDLAVSEGHDGLEAARSHAKEWMEEIFRQNM